VLLIWSAVSVLILVSVYY